MNQNVPPQGPATLDSFFKTFQSLSSAEEKLKSCIRFMRDSLAQSGTPFFKGFWEVRKLCLPLFKENLPGAARSQFWDEYVDLTREGRRLKNLLDQETAFEVEQIDLAIQALEKEIEVFIGEPEKAIENINPPQFPKMTHSLQGCMEYYMEAQKKLQLLGVFATRISALRKELIKTEMRIRQKNKFFQRLSALGDQVYPLRKQLIIKLSEAFQQDAQTFVNAHFSSENFSHQKARRSVFFLREEIKTWQALAKLLTLNTHVFASTREKLSECWDMLRGMEKEFKKEFAQQKQKSSENVKKIQEAIEEVKQKIQGEALSTENALAELDSVNRRMREVELTRSDVRLLKESMQDMRISLEKQKEDEEQTRRQKEEEITKAKRDQVEQIKQRMEELRSQIMHTDPDDLKKELEVCKQILQELQITKGERQVLERSLKIVRDQIDEKKEQALLALSEDERATLDHLQEVLEQKKLRRKEIKSQIEEFRKIIGGSGLDFEKGMHYQQLMVSEKERLEKMDDGINEIEKKIHTLKKMTG